MNGQIYKKYLRKLLSLPVQSQITLMAEEIKAIPIEWILKWACEFIDPNSEGYKMAMELVHDWEKENETNRFRQS